MEYSMELIVNSSMKFFKTLINLFAKSLFLLFILFLYLWQEVV